MQASISYNLLLLLLLLIIIILIGNISGTGSTLWTSQDPWSGPDVGLQCPREQELTRT